MQKHFSGASQYLYRTIAKPFFFRRDPEQVHNSLVRVGKLIGVIPPLRWLTRQLWAYQDSRLVTTLDGITFPNPVGLSAGFDYDANLTDIIPAIGFGFQTIGTVTLEPYAGNPAPRLGRFPRSKALLVNKGLKNIGARAIIAKLAKKRLTIPVGISIGSTNRTFATEAAQISNIVECFALFEASKLKHAYYELNISCPNTFGGEPFTTPTKLKKLVKAVTDLELSKPLYIKMPIDQSEAETLDLLKVLAAYPVQGVVFGNLTKDKNNPAVHPVDRKGWQNRKGNLSGKPTWERSNRLIKLTKTQFGDRFTIIGTGGIFNGQDALEKLQLGADIVQLITGMIYEGPQVIGQINAFVASRKTQI